MMSFRGFSWIYEVTEADEATRARAASFAIRLRQLEHERAPQDRARPLSLAQTPSVGLARRDHSYAARAFQRRVASEPFLVISR